MKVGVDQYEPVVFSDADGNAKGFCVDILEYIASKENWDIEYVICTWPDCLDKLESGEIDLILDIAYTEERDKVYDFTDEAVILDWGQLYGQPDSKIESIFDLDQKRIAVVKNGVFYLNLKDNLDEFGIKPIYIEVYDYDTVFELVDKGEVDAGISGRLFGQTRENNYDIEKSIIIFSPLNYHFAVPEGRNQEIIEILDRYLFTMKADQNSIYYQSTDKWLEEEVKFEIPEWIKIAGGILSVSVLLFALTSFILELQVKRKTAELSIKNEELKSLDQMKDVFLSNVSHELRTPLTSIKGYTQNVYDESLGDINGPQKTSLETVLRNADRLRRLVNSLLYISQAQAETIEYDFKECHIAKIISNTIMDTIMLVEAKDLHIEKEIPSDLPTIEADEAHLVDMLTNLIDNAIKFTPPGGTITLGAYEEEKYLHIEVKDTGIGIPEEFIPKLFQKFYQIDSSSKRRYGGTGVGLYICKSIVEAHKGVIWIESEVGKGTTVHIRLPR